MIWTCRMEYPGVGPELSFLKESGRAEFFAATDEEALDGITFASYYLSCEKHNNWLTDITCSLRKVMQIRGNISIPGGGTCIGYLR